MCWHIFFIKKGRLHYAENALTMSIIIGEQLMERKWKGIWLKKNLKRPHFKEDAQLPYFRSEFTVPKGASAPFM